MKCTLAFHSGHPAIGSIANGDIIAPVWEYIVDGRAIPDQILDAWAPNGQYWGGVTLSKGKSKNGRRRTILRSSNPTFEISISLDPFTRIASFLQSASVNIRLVGSDRPKISIPFNQTQLP